MDTTQKFQAAYDYAKQNPQSEFATELRRRIEAGQYDNELRATGIKLNGYSLKPTFQEATAETTSDLKQIGTDVVKSLAERNAKIEANKAAQTSGEQGSFRTGMQNLGQVLGFGADVIGDVIKGGVKAVLPQKNEDKVKENLALLYNNPIVKPLVDKIPAEELAQKFNQWKAENPAKARDLDALAGFAEFALNFVGAEGVNVGAKTAIKETGEQAAKQAGKIAAKVAETGSSIEQAITKGGQPINQFAKNIQESAIVKDIQDTLSISKPEEAQARFINKLVTPELSKTASEAAIKTGRVVESAGIGNERNFTKAIPGFERIKSSVEKVPGLDRKKTLLENSNLIHDEIGRTAESLKSQLKDKGFFSPNEFNGYMKKIKTELRENPTIVGDAEKAADRILNKFSSLVKEKGYTPEGLLEARKALDQWMAAQKPTAFDPNTENALTTALRAIRQGGNEFLIEHVPDVNVRELLQHQSNLYQAIENIAPKASKEGSSWWKRFISTKRGKVLKALGITAGTAVGLGAGAKIVQAITD